MRIAVLGTGQVGRTLASALADAGHDVTVGTRDPDATATREAGPRDESPWSAWSQEHPDVVLATFAGAADGADVIVNALPGAATVAGLAAIGETALNGTVVWDVANPLDFSHGVPPALNPGGADSLAETIQRAYPEARVVKALNTVNTSVMIPPPGGLADTHLPICGDSDDAKATVADLLADLGWDAARLLDLGGIEHARGMEGYLTLWFSMAQALGTPTFNTRIVHG